MNYIDCPKFKLPQSLSYPSSATQEFEGFMKTAIVAFSSVDGTSSIDTFH